MARNKYPEETLNKILTVSLNLFMEKGYEHTSIQDITNSLGGLTKGAVYHHFKSKEEILQAVIGRLNQGVDEMYVSIRDDKSLNGLEKLRKVFRVSLNDSSQSEIASTVPNLMLDKFKYDKQKSLIVVELNICQKPAHFLWQVFVI